MDSPRTTSWKTTAKYAVPAILVAGFLSGWLSGFSDHNPWYTALRKPALVPPGPVFGFAWLLLYTTIALSYSLIMELPPTKQRRNILFLFGLVLGLNLVWSPVFFGAHDIGVAKYLNLIMALVLSATIWLAFRLRQLAALLLLPYLAWLAFATFLVVGIANLNPEAGESLLTLTERQVNAVRKQQDLSGPSARRERDSWDDSGGRPRGGDYGPRETGGGQGGRPDRP